VLSCKKGYGFGLRGCMNSLFLWYKFSPTTTLQTISQQRWL
jgi:hypothetical protein